LEEFALGIGSALLLVGETGVGKSRLLDECHVLAANFPVARVACSTRFGSFVLEKQLDTRLGIARGVILVDDVQLASPDSLARLQELVDASQQLPVLIIATLDAAFFDSNQATLDCARLWAPQWADIMQLLPLSNEETEVLVRSLLHQQPMSAAVLREIVDTSEGNIRYAVEMAAMAASCQRIEQLVPASARAKVRGAIKPMSREAIETLCLCSVLGGRISAEWLVRAAHSSPRHVAEVVQVACDAGVLNEDKLHDGWFSFKHLAVAKVFYTSLVSPKRKQLHRDVAQRLRSLPIEGTLATTLARQHEALGDFTKARDYLLKAARDKMRDSDFAGAADLLHRIIVHIVPGSSGWLAVAADLLSCRWQLSQYGDIIPLGENLIENVDRANSSKLRIRTLWMLFYAYLNDDDRAGARRVADLLPASCLPNQIPREAAWLVLVCAYCGAGQRTQADELMKQIDRRVLTDERAVWRYAYARVVHDAPFASSQALQQSVAVAIRMAAGLDKTSAHHTYLAGVGSALQTGDVATALRYCEEADSLARQETGTQFQKLQQETTKFQALALLIAGDLETAKQKIIANVSWRTPGRYNDSMQAGIAVAIGMHTGDIGLVEAFFDANLLWQAVSTGESELCGLLINGFAELMEARGMSDDLHRCLRECIAKNIVDPYLYVALAASRHLPLSDLRLVLPYIQEYRRSAREPIAPAHEFLIRAVIDYRIGRRAQATKAARTAAQIYNTLHWRLAEALARSICGELGSALDIYTECGAHANAMRISAGSTRKAKHAPFGARLTQKENQVAALLSRDYSDRKIAESLSISVRTVHHHVEAILSKLGVPNRSRVASALSPSIQKGPRFETTAPKSPSAEWP
jgi:DNA-binding CsgD family transcriptional regulator